MSKEKRLAAQRKYYESHKEEERQRLKEWYEANKDDIKKKRAEKRKVDKARKLKEKKELEHALEISQCVQEFFPDVSPDELRGILQKLSEK